MNFQQSKYILQDPTIPVSINPNANLQASLILQLHFWLCLSFQSMHLRISVCNLKYQNCIFPSYPAPPSQPADDSRAGLVHFYKTNQPGSSPPPPPFEFETFKIFARPLPWHCWYGSILFTWSCTPPLPYHRVANPLITPDSLRRLTIHPTSSSHLTRLLTP